MLRLNRGCKPNTHLLLQGAETGECRFSAHWWRRYGGYTREAAIRPNSVTPQRTRNDRIAVFSHGKQSVNDARSRQMTDLVIEMGAECLPLEADGVLLGRKCPLLCRNESATSAGPVYSIRKLPTAGPEKEISGLVRAVYWV